MGVRPTTSDPTPRDEPVEGLLRRLAPQVLGALVRRHGDFDACEDAVQEALVAAAARWPATGVPDHPAAWLRVVATRRLVDHQRSATARRRREELVAPTEAVDLADVGALRADDTLELLLLCCDPVLSPAAQMALTLRAVGGLTTAEIAAAFLVPEATVAQRISRAKATLRERGVARRRTGEVPRLAVALHVLYLVFNEGYAATGAAEHQRRELAGEAIRLTRELHRLVPDDPEVTGLLALMLLTDARHAARTAPDGALVPLAEQDRSRWDAAAIGEGVALLEGALAQGRVGPYQLQAAIAAVHDTAPTFEDTDWAEILGLYRLLERVAPSPVVTLNHAVAAARVEGPRAGMALLERAVADGRLAEHHRAHAVRAHLHELAGDRAAAAAAYREAARRAPSPAERRHLEREAARLGDGAGAVSGERRWRR